MRSRGAVSLLAAILLLVAACGTRLDRQAIVAAGYGPASQSEAPGQVGPDGEPIAPGVADDLPDAAAPGGTADAGDSGAPGGPAAAPGRETGPGTQGPGGKPGGQQGRGGGGPIVIGSIGTYSGAIGAGQVPGVRGLQAWVSAVNAKGGINGRPVKLIVMDDGGNGAKARSQAQELIEGHKAVAIVASMSVLTIAQWYRYVEEKKVPVIGGDCAVDLWNKSLVLFSQCPGVDTALWSTAATGAKYAKGKKWGVLYCAEISACDRFQKRWFDDGWGKKAGMDPVYRARISLTQPDYTAECIAARDAGAEVLTVLSTPDALGRVASSCNRQNYHPQFLQGGGTVGLSTPSQPGLADVLAPMGTVPFAGLDTPAAREFQAAWQRYAGDTPLTGSSSVGWTAAKLFEKAAKLAGSDVTPAGLTKALHSISNDRLGGAAVPLTYRAGQPTPDFKCWMVMLAKNGKWTTPQGDKLSCR